MFKGKQENLDPLDFRLLPVSSSGLVFQTFITSLHHLNCFLKIRPANQKLSNKKYLNTLTWLTQRCLIIVLKYISSKSHFHKCVEINVTLNSNRNMLRKPNIMRNKTEQICLIISHTKLNTINCIWKTHCISKFQFFCEIHFFNKLCFYLIKKTK